MSTEKATRAALPTTSPEATPAASTASATALVAATAVSTNSEPKPASSHDVDASTIQPRATAADAVRDEGDASDTSTSSSSSSSSSSSDDDEDVTAALQDDEFAHFDEPTAAELEAWADEFAEANKTVMAEDEATGRRFMVPPPILRQLDPKCQVLHDFTLAEIAERIKLGRAKSIVVLAGAGISTSAGIPDFRSPGTGLYANLQKYNLPEPEDMFCVDYFEENPDPFFTLAKEMYPGQFKPTRTHHFLKLLNDKGLLRRILTQNIDALENMAGIPATKIVAAHGNFSRARCLSCRRIVTSRERLRALRARIFEGQPGDPAPRCDSCGTGLIKPDIVFFGEEMPREFGLAVKGDLPRADLVVVMGTSLKVAPFCHAVDHARPSVPRVLINRERVGEKKHGFLGMDFDGSCHRYHRDVFIKGSCDDVVADLCELLGWTDELKALEDQFSITDQLAQVQL
ncbi:NAD-dependent protein deacetylase sirtuin-2 [Allomyces arbusculus]|nr:NAD-dependent protein deacetylase sirtuin-2 [Allomyces arbusculus]